MFKTEVSMTEMRYVPHRDKYDEGTVCSYRGENDRGAVCSRQR